MAWQLCSATIDTQTAHVHRIFSFQHPCYQVQANTCVICAALPETQGLAHFLHVLLTVHNKIYCENDLFTVFLFFVFSGICYKHKYLQNFLYPFQGKGILVFSWVHDSSFIQGHTLTVVTPETSHSSSTDTQHLCELQTQARCNRSATRPFRGCTCT